MVQGRERVEGKIITPEEQKKLFTEDRQHLAAYPPKKEKRNQNTNTEKRSELRARETELCFRVEMWERASGGVKQLQLTNEYMKRKAGDLRLQSHVGDICNIN